MCLGRSPSPRVRFTRAVVTDEFEALVLGEVDAVDVVDVGVEDDSGHAMPARREA
jgi:hypothetical protein